MRLAILFTTAALLVTPTIAEEKRKTNEDAGVREAIAFERAKDRADAAQARKEAKNPEKFTYEKPKSSSDKSLANEQKREALEKNEKK